MKIALLTGGYDQEREVSLKSAQTWQDFLNTAWEKVEIFVLPQDEQKVIKEAKGFDLIVPIIHWKGWEDGYVISKILSKGTKVPYLFSPPKVMKITFDKAKTNEIVRSLNLGLKVPEFEKVNSNSDLDKAISKLAKYPKLILKPNQWGSSFDTFVLDFEGAKTLKSFVFKILNQRNEDFLLQQFVPIKHEFSASIFWDRDQNPKVLWITHIQYQKAFFDYEAKYEGASVETHYLMDEFAQKFGFDAAKVLEKDLLTIYQKLKIRTLARIDFVQDHQSNFWFLEINTIPGFTPASIYPSVAKKFFGNLVEFWKEIKNIYI